MSSAKVWWNLAKILSVWLNEGSTHDDNRVTIAWLPLSGITTISSKEWLSLHELKLFHQSISCPYWPCLSLMVVG